MSTRRDQDIVTVSIGGPGETEVAIVRKAFTESTGKTKVEICVENAQVRIFVGPTFPKQRPEGSAILVWLATGKLDPKVTVDFGISYSEFILNSQWHVNQILQLMHLRDHENLSREWRDTVVEKLEAKSELLEQMNKRLKKLSITDDLTGSYNHRFFRQLFSDEMDRATRYHFPLSILMIDIDHFKDVNDHHGHLVGDKVLILVAQELQNSVRRVDTVCRYGGEEFVVILPMTSRKPAQDLAERIRLRILKSCPQKNLPVTKVSVSIGVATFPDHGATTENLMESADRALYDAKAGGRNRVALAEDTSTP